MLTSMEFFAFSILVPLALVLFIVSLYAQKNSIRIVAYKLILIALLCAIVVPASAGITYMIRQTFAESINSVQKQIDEIGMIFSQMLGENSDGNLLTFISDLTAGIGSILEFAKSALGLLIDAVAILMITSCVIPLLTLLLFSGASRASSPAVWKTLKILQTVS